MRQGAGKLCGWTGWLIKRLTRSECAPPRLALLERLTLAPRQSLVLIEADGQRILVATSIEGAPAFYPLNSRNEFDVKVPVLGRIPIVAGKMSW
jgi:flagellar biogenesis protein FliO